MSDNATFNQILQIGAQASWNTGVAATKQIKSFNIDVDPDMEVDVWAPNGNIFPSTAGLLTEQSGGDLAGVLTYTEIVYPLSMLFGAAVIAIPSGGTLSRQWTWALDANSTLNPIKFSVEKGNVVYGIRSLNNILTSFNINWSRQDQIEIGGTVLGGAIVKPFTATNIVTAPTVEIIRAVPPHIDVYFDTTYAGLGTTKQLRAFEAGFSIDGLYNPIWPLNSALTGHDGVVGLMPDSESSMTLMANAAGMAFFDNIRGGVTGYLRIKATGPIIEGSIRYSFILDMPVQVKSVDAFTDSNGVYAIPWTFQPVDDGVNPPVKVTVVNKQIAL